MALNADAAAASKVILQHSLQHNFPVEINENVNADVGDNEGVKEYGFFYFSLLWLVGKQIARNHRPMKLRCGFSLANLESSIRFLALNSLPIGTFNCKAFHANQNVSSAKSFSGVSAYNDDK